MHTLEIPEIKLHKSYASNITELQPHEYIKYLELAAQLNTGEIDWLHFRIELAYTLLNITPKLTPSKLNAEQGQAMRANIYQISETLDSFLQTDPNTPDKQFLALGSIKTLVPTFHTAKNTWYAPADALSDISFGEYIQAFYAFRKYLEFQNSHPENQEESLEILKELTATLYYPVKGNGKKPKKRPPFSKEDLPYRISQLKDLSPTYHMAAFHYFKACIEFITKSDIDVNGHIINLSPLFTAPPTQQNTYKGAGLVDVLFSLGESGVFGTAKQAARENLYMVMLRLYQMHNEAERLKAKAKK